MTARPRCISLLLLLLAVGLPATWCRAGEAPGSPSFRIEPSAVDAGGRASASGSAAFRLEGSAGQSSPVSASSSFGYVLQSGFWSFAGTTVVPILLTATEAGSGGVELEWTGNDPPFDLCLSTNCADFGGRFPVTQSTKTFRDVFELPGADGFHAGSEFDASFRGRAIEVQCIALLDVPGAMYSSGTNR